VPCGTNVILNECEVTVAEDESGIVASGGARQSARPALGRAAPTSMEEFAADSLPFVFAASLS